MGAAAYREDLSEWISDVLNASVTPNGFLASLDDGVLLCRLAHAIHVDEVEWRCRKVLVYLTRKPRRVLVNIPDALTLPIIQLDAAAAALARKARPPACNHKAPRGSFFARDNLVAFLQWCEMLGAPKLQLFEPDGRNPDRHYRCAHPIALRAEAPSGLEMGSAKHC